MEEREAIARLKNRDIAGLEPLVRLYQVRAIRASYIICNDRSLAEDIVQAAFLRAYERIEQFDDRKPFGPWFLRSVVNDTLMTVSRSHSVSLENTLSQGETPSKPILPSEAGNSPEQMLEEAETRDAVRLVLNDLTPQERAVIVMRYYLDLNDKEISARMKCAPGTVRWRLHTARQRLRNLLPGWIIQPAED